MRLQQCDVALVGFPRRIEYVARERNQTDHAVDRDIERHPQKHAGRHARARGFADDVTGNDDPERVAEARNEANERVEAKPKTRTRQHEGAVEQPGKTAKPIQFITRKTHSRAVSGQCSGLCTKQARPGTR